MNTSVSTQERLARIQLNAFLYFRADWLERLIEIFGSAQEILRQDAPTLAREANLNPDTAAKLLQAAHAINPQEEWDKTADLGGHIYLPEDEEYPQSLRNCKEAPLAIYVLGHLPADERACVAVVGTRKITPSGRRVTRKLGEELAQCGVTVVSGLARGIDSEAHAAAVRRDAGHVRRHHPGGQLVQRRLAATHQQHQRKIQPHGQRNGLVEPG